MSSERRILTEFLQLYKDFACLWDNTQVLYSNKEAREKAYEVLLEKYKQIQEDATTQDVKKKIEYMRTTYRREHKKVLLSRLNGDVDEYVPMLWYYDHLTFLNDVADFSKLESLPRENGNGSLKIEYEEPKPKSKRRKVSTIYLPERRESNEDNDDYDDFPQDNENNSQQSMQMAPTTEAEAFGATVGLQLKELDPMQRVVAEKLISDVIFNGRLNRLTVNSSISTDSDMIVPKF